MLNVCKQENVLHRFDKISTGLLQCIVFIPNLYIIRSLNIREILCFENCLSGNKIIMTLMVCLNFQNQSLIIFSKYTHVSLILALARSLET